MNDKMLHRVRLLLAKAEDPGCTAEEAEALTAKAADIIAKYGIDRALAEAARTDGRPAVPTIRHIDIPRGAYARERATLMSLIANALGVESVWLTTRKPGRATTFQVHLIGFDSDLDRAELLYTSLLMQMHNGLAQAHKPLFEDTAAFRRTWMLGFSRAVHARVKEAEARAKHTAEQQQPSGSPGVALVLADRAALIARAKEEQYPDVPMARRRRLSGTGAADGYAAGQRADIGATRLPTGRTTAALTTR